MQDKVSTEDGANPNALSLFGQAANANDFPVLKAFQEYIDAEQAKARKRMLGLSIFFVVLLVAVVITFTIIVISIFTHNRELSDRLLDVAFRERQNQIAIQQPVPQPVVQPVVTPVVAPAQDSGIKPILEKLDALATALAARQQHALQPAPVVVTTAPATLAPSSPVENTETQQLREMIKKQQAELEAERNRLKETEEKLRKAEIERHRRRLYPEYYAQQEAQLTPAPAPVAAPVQPKQTPPPAAATTPTPAPEKIQEKPSPKPKPAARPATPLKNLKPIDYFAQSEDDELTPKPTPSVKQKELLQPSAAKKEASPTVKKQQPPPTPQAKKEAPSAPPQAKKEVPPAATKKEPSPAKKEVSVPEKKLRPPPSATKTETLDVTTSSDNSIPWLIEERDL